MKAQTIRKTARAKRNAFGKSVPQIKDVLTDAQVQKTVSTMMLPVMRHLGVPKGKAAEAINRCVEIAKTANSVEEYEKEAHEVLEQAGVTARIPEKLVARSERIHRQIMPYLKGSQVLDFGAGDGRVGHLVSRKGREATLSDVYEHGNIKSTGRPFVLTAPGQNLPFKNGAFDTSLALTVYHHTNDPLHAIRENRRVTKPGGHVLVIESVYGVDGRHLTPAQRKKNRAFLSLTSEQQRKVNVFFDHFYNRVIHYSADPAKKVNVPFNFDTPAGWKRRFERMGLKQEKVIHLGVDQPTVPEYHTLHVLRVRK